MANDDLDRFQRVQDLFTAAKALPATRWPSYVQKWAGDDPGLAAEVLAMLKIHAAGDRELLQQVHAIGQELAGPHAGDQPTRIGPYEILEPLGEGGQGTVYKAQQKAPMQRIVALKVIKLGMDSRAIVARFARERQTLALMSHEGIARIHDCGTTERGQPYFVMEFVDGVAITRYCDQHQLSLPQRLQLLQQACDAVEHAHQKGVLHRDLKPDNVLVFGDPSEPRVKIIDFGLAKSLAPDAEQVSLVTEVGRVLGTPEYMAPEQADASNADIDTRADIYALGAILYELLAGAQPFQGTSLRNLPAQELRRILTEVDPPRPSTRIDATTSEIATARSMSPAALRRALQDDLDWVVRRAMEKDRKGRYQSPRELAADLQRYLDQEPVTAGPPSASYRVRKLLRRHRRRALAIGVVVVVAVVFGWQNVATTQALRVRDQEFQQVAAALRYNQASDDVAKMPPPWPQHAAVMQKWLQEDAQHLLLVRPKVAQTLEQLRTRAVRATPDDAEAPNGPLRFADDADQFLYDTLYALHGNLETFEAGAVANVKMRLRWAELVTGLTHRKRSGPSWDAARAAIRSNSNYADDVPSLPDEDIVGLVPIGENPATGLWEFYDLRSAWDGKGDGTEIEIPRHDPVAKDGRLNKPPAGIVFVLLPRGTLAAAEKLDENGNPTGRSFRVDLTPSFLARHELTCGQWMRLMGDEDRPFFFSQGSMTKAKERELYPAEHVTWTEANHCLTSFGMRLPTEAQWEYGCRARSTTRWHTGDDVASLTGYAHLSFGTQETEPIRTGSLRANDFGLHDMHGNVEEWVLDSYHQVRTQGRPEDGLQTPKKVRFDEHVARGGCYQHQPLVAASHFRLKHEAKFRFQTLGVRAARSLHQNE